MRNPRGGHAARLRSQGLAFGIIRFLSFLTIGVLALILGFIVFRGLRYGNVVRSTVLSSSETAPDGLAIIVNDQSPLDRIEFPVLYGMYTDEYLNWSKITADKEDLVPVALDPASPEGARVQAFLFGDAEPQWGGRVEKVADPDRAVERVRSTLGAVAVLPADSVAGQKGVKVVSLRRLVIAANSEVTALVGNSAIEDLSDSSLKRLMTGKVSNWKELGGPDLAVRLLEPPAGSGLQKVIAEGAQAVSGGAGEKDMASYLAALKEQPGAVGYLFAGEALAAGIPALVWSGTESGWNLKLDYLLEAPGLSGKVGGISTIIANTFLMLVLTGLMAAPIGVAAAVYLVEYAKQGIMIRILRLGTETLAGIPSIIFGLFGFLFFVNILGFGFGLLSGCLTLTLMILPTIVRTSEEALKAVPAGLREGSLALGATKLQTIVRVAIPAAASGILTGLILGIGRAVGETAALLFTMGSDYKLAKGLFSSARVLSSHIYLLFAEGISFDRAFSTATVLILVVVAFNFTAKRLIGSMGRGRGQGAKAR
ncbi:MAG TPA: phosphate ABC transporter permease PstA [Rectinemataceae bacterium]|nr:phosphate ABC transporter permease PstA [Rectinemataceae bacterium]